jgi:uncharacterized protein YndB with AHSA1/START domain
MSALKFVPNTVYVTYIASTPEKVWEALTRAEFTRQYFFGHSIELEPKTGGSFILRAPDGSVHMRGRVIECDPPRRLATTWSVEGMAAFRELPESTRSVRSPVRNTRAEPSPAPRTVNAGWR